MDAGTDKATRLADKCEIAVTLTCRSPRVRSVEPRQQERPRRIVGGMAVIIGIIGVIGVIDVAVAMPVSATRADVDGFRRVGLLHRSRPGRDGRRNGEA